MGHPARKLVPDLSASDVEARRAALLALPLSDEPETAEESAIFEQAAADVDAWRRGHSTEEILETIEQMRRDHGE